MSFKGNYFLRTSFVTALALGMLATLSLAVWSCGKVEIKDAVGNASLVFDVSKENPLAEQGISLKRLRVWKSTPNAEAPGVAEVVDNYTVELWGTLTGETATRYQRFTGLLVSDTGDLYVTGFDPGTVVAGTNLATLSGRLAADGAMSYTILGQDALITSDFPVLLNRTENTGAGASIVWTNTFTNVATLAASPWPFVRSRTIANGPLFSRTRYEENTGLAIKGKLGCLVKTPDAASTLAAPTFTFGDVELGRLIQDKTGVVTNPDAAARATIGDDDSLWIYWSENWYVTGINIKTKTVRIMQDRAADYYPARELPGIDQGDTSPKVSGIESLVRACNAAATRSGGTFQFLSLSAAASATAPTVTLGTAATYCANLTTQVTNDPTVIPLNNVIYTSPAGACSTFTPGVLAGDWSGTTHSGNQLTLSGGASLTYVEQSRISAVAF